MPLFEARISPPRKLNTAELLPMDDFKEHLRTSSRRRIIPPGEEKEVTPWKEKEDMYGHRYYLLSNDNGTEGVLRMISNSSWSWGTIPGKDNSIRTVIGPRVFTLTPIDGGRDTFVIMRKTRRGYFAYAVLGFAE